MAEPFKPRARSLVIGAIPWLARMIDKARAEADGSIGEYEYPCAIDRRVLRELGISPEQFTVMATSASGDAEIIARVRAASKSRAIDA